MFTDKLNFPKELLPCEIGDTIYTIERRLKTVEPRTYTYSIDSDECEGFIIEHWDNELKIRPALNTWDGWCSICDYDGYGYYTSREEAVKKKMELEELELFNNQNKWLKEL